MLGFGKKKEKVSKTRDIKKGEDPSHTQETSSKKMPKKKTRSLKKTMVFVLLFLVAVGAVTYLVYALYFKTKDPDAGRAFYKKVPLRHLTLPEEMVQFSFEYFPELYGTMISFNKVMELFDTEIARIDAIGKRYPDQKKIADKEKKTWEKEKNALEKAFIKIEKPVKETYVLFRVNKEQGLAQINAQKKELTELAHTALAPALEQARNLQPIEVVPQGLIKGNIYKLKKKFL